MEELFDSIVEYLYIEGYADTIETAELIAEHAGEEWIETIIDAVDWSKSEPGKHTGDAVPIRKMSAANRHKFEQERRRNLSKKPGDPAGDSKLIQAFRKRAQDTGNYAN